jgi:D-lactate dehydrogenase
MKRIKEVIDPQGLLNPGVIINNDKEAHIKFLKGLPTVEEEVDRCIECGYCEHRCPSRDLTTTPRRRIVIRRILKNLEQQGDKAKYKLLLDQYRYDGDDTCAVDGLCATACPVDIDTGDLTKRLRRENHKASSKRLALFVAKNFGTAEGLVSFGLKAGVRVNRLFGRNTMLRLTSALRRVIASFPLWSNSFCFPPGLSGIENRRSQTLASGSPTVLYFPACITRVMGTYDGKVKTLMETFMSICQKAGIQAVVMDDLKGSCCGQVFSSKGFDDAYRYTANKIVNQLWTATREGVLPVVIDVSSCAHTLLHLRPVLNAENNARFDKLIILDSIDFLHDMVIPASRVKHRKNDIVLHPVCSLEKMKTQEKFLKVAKHFAQGVTIPRHAGCCGMAGDRGFLFPELTDSATHHEASEVRERNYDGYYSSTRTCEIAMSDAVMQNYESILYLVEEAL